MSTDIKAVEEDLLSARALAAAALPGMVVRLSEMGMVCEDPEVVRKAADTLAKIAEPRKDEAKSSLPVFNITFMGSGQVTAEPMQPLEVVQEVQPKPLELTVDEPSTGAVQEDVLAFLQELGAGDAEL